MQSAVGKRLGECIFSETSSIYPPDRGKRDTVRYHFGGDCADRQGITASEEIGHYGKWSSVFINIKDIQNARLEFGQADRIQRTSSVCKAKFRISKDDILLTSKGAVLKAAIVEANPPEAYISGNITMIRVDQRKYDPYVLFEFLISEQGQIALERIQSGTTIRIISNASLQTLKFRIMTWLE